MDQYAHKANHRRLQYLSYVKTQAKKLGIKVVEAAPGQIPGETFFKGCWIDRGTVYYLKAFVDIGELVHELGHLALIPKRAWKQIEPTACTIFPPLGPLKEIGDAGVEAWGFVFATAHGISPAALFKTGFDGNGDKVWESFIERWHPGFTVLRWLEMSSSWGSVDRWLLSPSFQAPPEDEETMLRYLHSCTQDEVRAVLAALKARSGKD